MEKKVPTIEELLVQNARLVQKIEDCATNLNAANNDSLFSLKTTVVFVIQTLAGAAITGASGWILFRVANRCRRLFASRAKCQVACAKLNSGFNMPLVGLGTWLSKPGEVGSAVEFALGGGCKLIDCAYVFQNQKEIGLALAKIFGEGKIKREDVFITSKVWNTFHPYDLAQKCVDETLADLQLDYLDLCLIHWPMAYKEGDDLFPRNPENPAKMAYSDADYLDTWKALEAKVKEKKIRSIGLSNFGVKQIQRVIENGTIKPAVLQVELHPYLQQKELVDYCKSQSIVVTSYQSLRPKKGDLNLLADPTLLELSMAHGKTVTQVVLKALVQKGIAVIPKSVNENMVIGNANINDFSLTDEEMMKFESLDKNLRFLDIKQRDGDHPHFPW